MAKKEAVAEAVEIQPGMINYGGKSEAAVCEIQIADIINSEDNPRIINTASQSFIELAESIKSNGVLIPVHVRDHPKQSYKFELLAGQRRLEASKKAGCKSIPAVCHGTMSDEQDRKSVV